MGRVDSEDASGTPLAHGDQVHSRRRRVIVGAVAMVVVAGGWALTAGPAGHMPAGGNERSTTIQPSSIATAPSAAESAAAAPSEAGSAAAAMDAAGRGPGPAVPPAAGQSPEESSADGQVPVAVNEVIQDFVGLVEQIPADGGRDFTQFEDAATGSALEDIRVEAEELSANKWTVEGTPAVVHVTPIPGGEPDGAVRTVEACIDSSLVVVTDADGAVVRPSEPGRKSLNIYTLELHDGDWLVAGHSFPSQADC